MAIPPIRTGTDHDAALARIKTLRAARPDTPVHDELDVLFVLVSAYEVEHWLIGAKESVA